MNASELYKPGFCQAPKVFNAIISLKSVCKHLRIFIDSCLYYWQKCGCRAIFSDLGIYLFLSFFKSKYNAFTLLANRIKVLHIY